jgi:hypothetical protein
MSEYPVIELCVLRILEFHMTNKGLMDVVRICLWVPIRQTVKVRFHRIEVA